VSREPVRVELGPLLLVQQALARGRPRALWVLCHELHLTSDEVRRALLALDAYQLEEPVNAAPPRDRRLVQTLERVEVVRRRR
jgi:hypothetical protein